MPPPPHHHMLDEPQGDQPPERRAGQRDLNARVLAIELRTTRIEATLKQNSEATNDILDIIQAGRGFFKVLGYIGFGAKWLLGLGASALTLWVAYQKWRGQP